MVVAALGAAVEVLAGWVVLEEVVLDDLVLFDPPSQVQEGDVVPSLQLI